MCFGDFYDADLHVACCYENRTLHILTSVVPCDFVLLSVLLYNKLYYYIYAADIANSSHMCRICLSN